MRVRVCASESEVGCVYLCGSRGQNREMALKREGERGRECVCERRTAQKRGEMERKMGCEGP